jgi:hypothetical protein
MVQLEIVLNVIQIYMLKWFFILWYSFVIISEDLFRNNTSVWRSHTRTHAYTVVQIVVFKVPGASCGIIPNSYNPPTHPHLFQRSDAQLLQTGRCIFFLMSSVHTWEYSNYRTIVALKAIKLTAHGYISVSCITRFNIKTNGTRFYACRKYGPISHTI